MAEAQLARAVAVIERGQKVVEAQVERACALWLAEQREHCFDAHVVIDERTEPRIAGANGFEIARGEDRALERRGRP